MTEWQKQLAEVAQSAQQTGQELQGEPAPWALPYEPLFTGTFLSTATQKNSDPA